MDYIQYLVGLDISFGMSIIEGFAYLAGDVGDKIKMNQLVKLLASFQ